MQQVWTWFLAPPAALLAAYYLSGSVERQAAPLPPPPAVASLQLPAAVAMALRQPAQAAPVVREPVALPREIQLSAFGIIVPAELARVPAGQLLPPARELFRLESVLVAGERRLAVIDGQLYQVGQPLSRRYRLVQIDPDGVWLRGPRGREALRFPEWRDAPPVAVAAAPPVALQPPPRPGQAAQQAAPATTRSNPVNALESEYRKILEMLKL